MFNHIQTIAEEKRYKRRNRGRQRNFGNCNHWLRVLNNENKIMLLIKILII